MSNISLVLVLSMLATQTMVGQEVRTWNPAFLKNNFGYLPRECVQNYDRKTKTMLITYDINTANTDEIIAHPEIYTPKMVKVQLTKNILSRH